MKISDKQALFLFQVLRDTLPFSESSDGKVFSYGRALRIQMYDEIFHQQSDEPVERDISKCQHQFVKVCENPYGLGEIYWQCLHCRERRDD